MVMINKTKDEIDAEVSLFMDSCRRTFMANGEQQEDGTFLFHKKHFGMMEVLEKMPSDCLYAMLHLFTILTKMYGSDFAIISVAGMISEKLVERSEKYDCLEDFLAVMEDAQRMDFMVSKKLEDLTEEEKTLIAGGDQTASTNP